MSNCSLFNISLFDSIIEKDKLEIDINWLKNLIPAYNDSRSGLWYPVFINHTTSKSEYGNPLYNPQNINDSYIAPCNCKNVGARVARNTVLAFSDFSDENEAGSYCSYCEKLQTSNMNCLVDVKYEPKNDLGDPAIIQWPIVSLTPNPVGGATNYSIPCCRGGCDTRMVTDDVTPKIPYLTNNYTTKFFDFKYLQQFPAIENPGLGYDKFISYKGSFKDLSLNNMFFHIDWTLKPRLGEIEPTEDTYHTNQYTHRKSYSRYLLNNKTCGNFILQTVNAPTQISAWQSGNMPLLSGLNLDLPVASSLGSSGINLLVPKISEFTIPYGITDDTHYNVFLKQPSAKAGSFWKWNFTSGVLCWYRYYDKDRENDQRVIPGVDLYISDGDVFFAENDGPEPLAGTIPTSNNNCEHKICPSGLKFSEYQTQNASGLVTVVPSGSEFIYISNNIYEKFYNLLEKLTQVYKSSDSDSDKSTRYKQIVNQAAILATGPDYEGITIDLFTYPSGYSDDDINQFIKIIKLNTKETIKPEDIKNWFTNKTDSARDEYKRLISLNKKLSYKLMPSYNNINMIKTKEDLVRTLAHKYGSYLWTPPKTEGQITIKAPSYSHAHIEMDFEPYIKISDTKCLSKNQKSKDLTCDANLRGSSKIFGYDQYFGIGESYLDIKILNNNLVFSLECSERSTPPTNRITDVADTMSVKFRDKTIYERAHGSYETSFSDIYSRFPSVSSTLDSTFSNLSDEQDGWNNVGVFSLVKDAQLRLNRRYNAFAVQPNVDLVGFHEDGGCYYESTLLNKNNGTGTVAFIKDWKPQRKKNDTIIKFKTYDLGIKTYSINAQKLRSKDNLSCKTFPLDQSCNCWGINKVANYPYRCEDSVVYETPDLFTPFLSTKNIPLLAYGGYDSKTVDSYLGQFRIPDHPDISEKLPKISKIIDVDSINGCKETASITLPNYVASKWTIKIPSFDTQDATIWVKYQDSFNAYNDRTQNKIVINGQEIFPNEQKILNDNTNIFEIKIYNQFLTSIFEDKEKYLYNKDTYTCSIDKTNSPYDTTPKYLKPSTITLYFGRIPNKNLLSFKLPGLQVFGSGKKAFFEPNSGLRLAKDNENIPGSALDIDRFNGLFNFDYGYKLFNNTGIYDKPISPTDITYSGSISLTNITKLLQFINLKEDTKKLKLYLNINDKWYEYEDHKSFGYYNIQENIQYHSWPTFFVQNHIQTDQSFGPFIPATPKVPLEYIYCRNIQNASGLIQNGSANYPYLNLKFTRDFHKNKYTQLTSLASIPSKRQLWIKGARAYFAFPIATATGTKELLSNEENILYPNNIKPKVSNTGSTKWPVYSEKTQVTEIYSVPITDLDTKINTIENLINSSTNLSINSKPNKIIAKHLIYYDNSITGTRVDSIVDISNNFYTVLEMAQDHPHEEGYISLDKKYYPITSLSLFATTETFNLNTDSNEIIKFNSNDKNTFSNKWSDIIYYNNTRDILNNRPYYHSIDDVYGPFLYDNILNYIIANNFMRSHLFPTDSGTVNTTNLLNLYIQNTGSTGVLNFDSSLVNYYIHQPYSLGLPEDKYYLSANKFNLFKNQNPIIDININENKTEVTDKEFHRKKILEDDSHTGRGLTGVACISGIYRSYYETPKYISSSGLDFFINLNNNFKLKATPITSNGLYSKSLVVSETYNVLDGLILDTKINTNTTPSCDSIILPNISIPPLALNNSVFNWSNFSKTLSTGTPYVSYPVFCNSDTIGGCADTKDCSITQAGSVYVSSKFKNYIYKYQNINSLLTNINMLDYMITLDAGLYCPLRPSGDIPYIVRSSNSDYSVMFPNNTLDGNSNCIDGKSYPPLERGLSVWDDLYQSEISNNIVSLLDIDKWANEILFRGIHGSKQNINLNNISSYSSDNITHNSILSSLINNPNNNLDILYNNIPYDYDINTSNKLKINGAIRIYGNVKVGDSTKITYNGQVFTINIKDDGNDIYAECPEIDAKGLLIEKIIESKSIYIREKGTNSSQPGASERVIGTCKNPFDFNLSTTCADPTICVYGIGSLEPVCQYQGATVLAGPYTITANTYTEGSPSVCKPKPHKETIVVSDIYSAFQTTIITNGTCAAFPKIKKEEKNDILKKMSLLDNSFSRHIAHKYIAGSPGSNPSLLECSGFGAETCSRPKNCCNNATNVIKTISYRIKDCHYDFTMYGLLTKSINNIATLTTENRYSLPSCSTSYSDAKILADTFFDRVRPTLDCPCDCNNASNNYLKDPYPVNDPACNAFYENTEGGLGQLIDCCRELCDGTFGTCKDAGNLINTNTLTCKESYLLLVDITPSTIYEVVESTTTSANNITLKAACARTLCTFIYDNNQVKLYLGSSKTRNGVEIYNGGNCSNIQTNNCPSIKIELPNNNYGIDDTNSSSCSECSTEDKRIEIISNPDWEFATDTVYCLLDSVILGGSFHPSNAAISLLCREGNDDSTTFGFDRPRTCGKPPDRNCTSWHHFASNPILGSDSKPESKCDENILINNGYHIDFPLWTTNSVAVAKYEELWKQKMTEIYQNKHYCTNKYDYKIEELIEGVVPGSCSLVFETVSWPMIGVQLCADVDGCGIKASTEKKDGSINILIAYITYQYKHPVNLTDKIIDEFNEKPSEDSGDNPVSQQCRNYFGIGGFSSGCRAKYFGNMKEEIKSKESRNSNCTSTPQCYDRNRSCDPSNICCGIDQTGNTYRRNDL